MTSCRRGSATEHLRPASRWLRSRWVVGLSGLVLLLASCVGHSQEVSTGSRTAPTPSASANGAVPPQLQLGDSLITLSASQVDIRSASGKGNGSQVGLPFKHPLVERTIEAASASATRQVLIAGRQCDEAGKPEEEEGRCTPGSIVATTLDLDTMKFSELPSPAATLGDDNRSTISAVPGVRPIIQVVHSGDTRTGDETALVELVNGKWDTIADTQLLRGSWAAVAVEACSTSSAVFVKILGSTADDLGRSANGQVVTSDYPRRSLTGMLIGTEGAEVIKAAWTEFLNSELTRIGCSASAMVIAGPDVDSKSLSVWASAGVSEWKLAKAVASISTPPRITSNYATIDLNLFDQSPALFSIRSVAPGTLQIGDFTSLLTISPGTDTGVPQVPYEVTNLTPSAESSLTFEGQSGTVSIPTSNIDYKELP